ncbi:hypothetical protein BMS3Bbin02_01706 [bacterium BMS3Bbin02]|nr:hypothetical protein BMS3Bbin02_01706 [bacterium BMS3Bbin02]
MPPNGNFDADLQDAKSASHAEHSVDLDAGVSEQVSNFALAQPVAVVEHGGLDTQAIVGLRNPGWGRCPLHLNICARGVHLFNLIDRAAARQVTEVGFRAAERGRDTRSETLVQCSPSIRTSGAPSRAASAVRSSGMV